MPSVCNTRRQAADDAQAQNDKRDEEFFKKTDSILEQFIIEEPKEKEVSDEEKVSKGSDK